jgi:hypothetical protein
VTSAHLVRLRARLSVVLFVVLLGGCAHGVLDKSEIVSTGPATRVTLIRESRFIGGGSPAIITLDDKKVLALWSGEHATLPVRPGYRQICQRWTAGKGGVFRQCDTLWLLDGQDRYYVLGGGGAFLKRLSKEDAEPLLRRTKRLVIE